MTEDAKLDLLMNLLETQEGWTPYRDAILAKQKHALETIMRGPANSATLEQLYASIAEFNAFARVLGIPGELGNKAITARKAEADGKTSAQPGTPRPSATARARKAAETHE